MMFCLDALGRSHLGIDGADAKVSSQIPHDGVIGQLCHGDPQLLSHVALRLADLHAPGHLHACHQVSGGAHPAHA